MPSYFSSLHHSPSHHYSGPNKQPHNNLGGPTATQNERSGQHQLGTATRLRSHSQVGINFKRNSVEQSKYFLHIQNRPYLETNVFFSLIRLTILIINSVNPMLWDPCGFHRYPLKTLDLHHKIHCFYPDPVVHQLEIRWGH